MCQDLHVSMRQLRKVWSTLVYHLYIRFHTLHGFEEKKAINKHIMMEKGIANKICKQSCGIKEDFCELKLTSYLRQGLLQIRAI